MCVPLVVGILCLSLLCCALLCVFSSFAIILKRKRKLVALLLLSYGCLVTVNVLWPFLALPWVGLRCVIVVFPDHVNLLFCICSYLVILLLPYDKCNDFDFEMFYLDLHLIGDYKSIC